MGTAWLQLKDINYCNGNATGDSLFLPLMDYTVSFENDFAESGTRKIGKAAYISATAAYTCLTGKLFRICYCSVPIHEVTIFSGRNMVDTNEQKIVFEPALSLIFAMAYLKDVSLKSVVVIDETHNKLQPVMAIELSFIARGVTLNYTDDQSTGDKYQYSFDTVTGAETQVK